MNVFNRIVMVILLIVVFLAILALTVFPLTSLAWLGRTIEAWRDYLAYLESSAPYLYVGIRVGVVVVAAIVLGVLLYLEVQRRRPAAVRVVTGEGSTASIATDAVSQRLVFHVDRLADVISVEPQVTGRGRTVHVKLNLETTPEIDVPMKTDEVVAVVREVVEGHMGLELGKVQVNIKHVPYPEEMPL